MGLSAGRRKFVAGGAVLATSTLLSTALFATAPAKSKAPPGRWRASRS